jgi:hypothetical protein
LRAAMGIATAAAKATARGSASERLRNRTTVLLSS